MSIDTHEHTDEHTDEHVVIDDFDGEGPAEADIVEVRRDGPLSVAIAGLAGAVGLAYLVRALGEGGGLDWILAGVLGLVYLLHAAVVIDSRAPLMVIDRHGIRARFGRHWEGIAWADVARVEHRVRERMLRDGRLSVVDHDGRRLAVRLSLSTRLHGCDWHELGDAVADLSGGVRLHETRPVAEADVVPPTPDAPEPEREVAEARRADVELDRVAPAEMGDAEETAVITLPRDVESPAVEALDSTETSVTVVIGDLDEPGALTPSEQRPEPVVGAALAAARERLRLSVDQLADRTRIRPHVIEAIEVDDFEPCGGDFYARGHLRTLARVLGVDAEELLARYDDSYAHAPIDARRVFEAELATGPGGSIRATRGGLNWSVLVAVVMAAVLVWSIARLVMEGPVPLSDRPVLNGSPGGNKAQLSGTVSTVPVEFTAATGGAHVIVRDHRGRIVFDEELAFMQTAKVQVSPPVRIQTSDGGLQVTVDGDDEGAVGSTGEESQQVYAP